LTHQAAGFLERTEAILLFVDRLIVYVTDDGVSRSIEIIEPLHEKVACNTLDCVLAVMRKKHLTISPAHREPVQRPYVFDVVDTGWSQSASGHPCFMRLSLWLNSKIVR